MNDVEEKTSKIYGNRECPDCKSDIIDSEIKKN